MEKELFEDRTMGSSEEKESAKNIHTYRLRELG